MQRTVILSIVFALLILAYIVSLILESPYAKDILEIIKMVVIAIISYYLGSKTAIETITTVEEKRNFKKKGEVKLIAIIGIAVAIISIIFYFTIFKALYTLITSIFLLLISVLILKI